MHITAKSGEMVNGVHIFFWPDFC